MKFSFKKIASVLACGAMLGSTLGFAAAVDNYPVPFVKSGVGDVAVVVGTNAATGTDSVYALELVTDLNKAITPASTVQLGEGDKMKFESTSKLNMNSALTDVKVTDISSGEMPNLLKKMTYRSYDSADYDYEQKLTLYQSVNLTQFQDSEYKNRDPSVGISLTRNTYLMNYSLSFVKVAISDVTTANHFEDFENSKITMLGKEYTIVQAYNNTAKLVLMGGAVLDNIALNDEQTKTVNGKTYNVQLTYVDASKAKFTVNGESSGDIAVGGTWKFSDAIQLGVRALNYQAFAGGVMSVDYSLGADKLTIENGNSLYLNDASVDDVTCTIAKSASGGKEGISKITLTWRPSSKVFVTDNSSATFPGLKAVSLAMTDFFTPKKEEITVGVSNTVLQLKAPIKSGDAVINVLYGNGTTFNGLGYSATQQLRTTNTSVLVFNTTTDDYYIASWTSGTTAGETYLLKNTFTSSSGINYTSVKDAVSGTEYCGSKKPAESCTIGSVVLTVGAIDPNGWVNLTAGSGVNFNKLYTTGGATIWLPFVGNETVGLNGAINLSTTSTSPTTFKLVLKEGDKNGNLGDSSSVASTSKQLNFTAGWTTDSKVTISAVTPGGGAGQWSSGNYYSLPTDSQTYVGYLQSPLATKATYYTAGNADYAVVEYHGGESYGNVYLTSSVTSGGASTIEIVKDSEAPTDKSVIVVGGSCVNTLAATLLAGTTDAVCGPAFTAATGVSSDMFLIETFAHGTNKIATVVAGYEATDTQNAVAALIANKPEITIGKKFKGDTTGVLTAA